MSARKVAAKAQAKKGESSAAVPARRGRPAKKLAGGLAFEQKVTPERLSAVKKTAKGDRYICEVCGLAVIVDEVCGCGACQIICCGEPMKPKPLHRQAFPLLP